MQNAGLHALVLGSALVLAAVILLVRSSHGGRPESVRDPVEADAAPRKPQAGGAGKKAPDAGDAGGVAKDEGPLAKAERQIRQAEALYRAAAGKEGREEEIEEAKRRVKDAQALLDDLPQDDPKVRELVRKRQQLHEDLIKVSNL